MTAVVALLFMASAGLRGYVPGADAPVPQETTESPWSEVVVVGLLVAAVAVVVVAVVVRLFTRGQTAPRAAARSDWLRGDRGKPTARMALLVFAFVLGWLVLYVLLSRLVGGAEEPAATPDGGPPSAGGDTAGTADPAADLPLPPDDGNLLGYFLAATVIFLIVIVIGAIVASRRRYRPPPPAATNHGDGERPDDAPGSESLSRAAEVALAEVGDLSREPRKAIIACYVAMEGELALRPDSAPRDFDTASEVLARAVEFDALRPDSARRLVDLFEEARFSPHVMTEDHRDAAMSALTQVLDELRSRA